MYCFILNKTALGLLLLTIKTSPNLSVLSNTDFVLFFKSVAEVYLSKIICFIKIYIIMYNIMYNIMYILYYFYNKSNIYLFFFHLLISIIISLSSAAFSKSRFADAISISSSNLFNSFPIDCLSSIA